MRRRETSSSATARVISFAKDVESLISGSSTGDTKGSNVDAMENNTREEDFDDCDDDQKENRRMQIDENVSIALQERTEEEEEDDAEDDDLDDDLDAKIRRTRDENLYFAQQQRAYERTISQQGTKLDEAGVILERYAAKLECDRAVDALFELLRDSMMIHQRDISRTSSAAAVAADDDDDGIETNNRRGVARSKRRRRRSTSDECYNFVQTLDKFEKALKESKMKEQKILKALDNEEFDRNEAKTPLKKLLFERASETDRSLANVREKLEMLRAIALLNSNNNNSNHSISNSSSILDESDVDIENGRRRPQKKKTIVFAKKIYLTQKQMRTNQLVLSCVVGVLIFALFVATFVWLWTNEVDPWVERSIRENRERLTYEEIVYEPIDHSNVMFDS